MDRSYLCTCCKLSFTRFATHSTKRTHCIEPSILCRNFTRASRTIGTNKSPPPHVKTPLHLQAPTSTQTYAPSSSGASSRVLSSHVLASAYLAHVYRLGQLSLLLHAKPSCLHEITPPFCFWAFVFSRTIPLTDCLSLLTRCTLPDEHTRLTWEASTSNTETLLALTLFSLTYFLTSQQANHVRTRLRRGIQRSPSASRRHAPLYTFVCIADIRRHDNFLGLWHVGYLSSLLCSRPDYHSLLDAATADHGTHGRCIQRRAE